MQDIILFIQRHTTLALALALAFSIILIILLIVEFLRLKRGSNQISPAQLTHLINHKNAVIVDIRQTDAFTTGHIVDAISLPLKDLANKMKKIEKFKSQPIVLICAAGLESQRGATILVKEGFDVFILAGGIRAWQTAELPLIKG